MKFPSRPYGLALAALITVAATGIAIATRTSADGGGTDAVQQQPASAQPAERRTPKGLLEHAWATDGTAGYFVDDGGRPATAMSLYDTAWWQRAIDGDPQWGDRLDREVVASWLLPVLYGEAQSGDADTAGMPRLAVLDHAVMLATTLKIAVDGPRVATLVEQLRAGPLYKSDATSTAGDWASTAIALRVLNAVGQHPPAEVSAALDGKLAEALSSRRPGDLFAVVVPVLTSVDPHRLSRSQPDLARQLDWVRSQLPAMIPLERLTAADALRPLVAQAKSTPWPTGQICRGLLVTAGGVRINERSEVDAQATAIAVGLGCVPKPSPPPWTIGGWPAAPAMANAIQSSVAGVRIAIATGTLSEYEPQLIAWTKRRSTPSPASAASLAMLAKLLDSPGRAAPTPASLAEAVAAPATMQTLPTLVDGWLHGERVTAARPASAAKPAGTSVFLAAASELKFRITGDAAYREDSRSMLRRLAVNGLYASAVGDGSVPEPSVVATAIAAWVLGETIPVQALQAAGLCGADLSCSGPLDDVGAPLDSPLRATAAVLAASNPDPAGFPLAL